MAVSLPRSADAVQRAVEAFGSQTLMAAQLGVKQSTVSEWASGRRPVPVMRCPQIEGATRARGNPVTCEQLRPDVAWSVVRANQLEASST